ncbi:hypothetical protein SLEP1_g26283 [Rubroshorea leprosula]|uniref:Uncharacterized protein n=1 Tax=Rubroshorea leprosula TaxID=152421 RepID=A0AAV5JST7_9ROSI|nr:hypothetical protein SLEP1_g26283 [Rubroshorea leprosula]
MTMIGCDWKYGLSFLAEVTTAKAAFSTIEYLILAPSTCFALPHLLLLPNALPPESPPKAAEASPLRTGKELEFSLFFLDGEQGLNLEISSQPLARSALLLPRPCNPRKKPAADDIFLEKTGKAW